MRNILYLPSKDEKSTKYKTSKYGPGLQEVRSIEIEHPLTSIISPVTSL